MKRRTFFNLLGILLVLSFFVTPLGYESKVLLQRIFADSVRLLPQQEQFSVDFDWKLKDAANNVFNFNRSEGKPVFVYFWSSWRVTSVADLYGVQALYQDYKDKVDFYIITNELPEPVQTLMQKRGFDFQETYLIIGEKMPFDAEVIPSGYLIDKTGKVVACSQRNAQWNSPKVRQLIEQLLR